ncbi:PIN domain-like protein [Hymenopellis radicata]|nr:PIN domain-like protein [Hymenopellis radicata]
MHHVHKGSNAEVKELLRRLAKLLNFAIVPLFIFDGPERPKLKRGKRVVHSPGWLIGIFKELIDAFGFYHLDARGEAEAELAALNYRKLIDLVITDDGDAVIFGTCTLGRSLDLKEQFPSLTIYSRNRITEELGMSPGGLLLFALLAGGDYDQTGLKGCGGAIAAGLARTSLGDKLREAFHEFSPADFVVFCQAWRVDLARELTTNASGMLPSRCPSLAKKIPATFPNYTVVKLYAAPIVTERLTNTNFVPRAPDLETVMDIYARYIHPTFKAKLKLLHDDIVPGYYFKALQLGQVRLYLYKS